MQAYAGRMISMLNAGILLASRNTFPKILGFLAVPRVEDSFPIVVDPHEVQIHIIRFPLAEEQRSQYKINKAFLKLCRHLDIGYTAAKAGMLPEGKAPAGLEECIDPDTAEEIQAIKVFAALLKASREKDDDLLCGNIGFAATRINRRVLDILSEDAASVMVYEHSGMKEAEKAEIYGGLLRQKGISTIFTKDLGQLVAACDVILTDGTAKLEGFEDSMRGKILLGESSVTGPFKKIETVILWNEALDALSPSDRPVAFNDELLAVARHLNAKDTYIDFIKRFPYIYFL